MSTQPPRFGSTPRVTRSAVVERAQRLRRGEPSAGERAMWALLRRLNQRGAHFRREAALGDWVYDFAWLHRRVVIEVDGGVHRLPEVAWRDAAKTRAAVQRGWTLLRYDAEHVIRAGDSIFEDLRGRFELERFVTTPGRHRRPALPANEPHETPAGRTSDPGDRTTPETPETPNAARDGREAG